jgi:GDP-L-fucose synthase
VLLCAARVGGIWANLECPATFLLDNLQIQNSVIAAVHRHGVKRFVFLGSSCIYPRNCPQPMKEEHLLTGALEPTNEGYAVAKIAGPKLLEAMHRPHGFNSISLMPCNLYGPNDSSDLQKLHVLSVLGIAVCGCEKAVGAPSLTLWGTGIACSEFMHADDLARIVVFMIERREHHPCINIDTGEDLTIRKQVGCAGELRWDATGPDGMLRKCMDVSRIHALGFALTISLDPSIAQMIDLHAGQKGHA